MALQTVEEVSRRLKVTPAAIRMAIRHGRIPAVRFGRRLRVQDETVDALYGDRLRESFYGKPASSLFGRLLANQTLLTLGRPARSDTSSGRHTRRTVNVSRDGFPAARR